MITFLFRSILRPHFVLLQAAVKSVDCWLAGTISPVKVSEHADSEEISCDIWHPRPERSITVESGKIQMMIIRV
jgi:hypothetical protein